MFPFLTGFACGMSLFGCLIYLWLVKQSRDM